MDTLFNWAFRLFIMALLMMWWYRSTKNGKKTGPLFCGTLLVFFAWSIGEGYYLKTGKLPWLFGLEEKIAERTDAGAAFAFIVAGMILWWLTYWILPKVTNWWNNSKLVPGHVNNMTFPALGLTLLLTISPMTSAILCHGYGITWGMHVVSLGGNICAEASELGLSENDRMQDEIDEATEKAQRRAPVREHRNTTNGKNARGH
ncbi:MAG: hypothetical protein AAB445_04325 [Patescibacteria group bacterium]